MKIKFDCPLDFLDPSEVEGILKAFDAILEDGDPECIIVNPGTDRYLGEEYFKSFKNLKIVGTPSTGVNHIDVPYLNGRGVSVKCLLDDRGALDNIHASAEFTWIHIMNLVRKFNIAIDNKDKWRSRENELFLRSNELHQKRLAIIGVGRIGKKIIKYAKAFGMDVYWYDPYVSDNGDQVFLGTKKVDSIRELKDCDIVSINCYLTHETNKLITYGVFDDFKHGLGVVNTSRGEVVDEEYIYELIIKGKIRYSTDVLSSEQDLDGLHQSKLFNLKHDNLIITPHVAGATKESQTKALVSILGLCKSV